MLYEGVNKPRLYVLYNILCLKVIMFIKFYVISFDVNIFEVILFSNYTSYSLDVIISVTISYRLSYHIVKTLFA
jgi:hypothetical protein